jgi:hypothetical protein
MPLTPSHFISPLLPAMSALLTLPYAFDLRR